MLPPSNNGPELIGNVIDRRELSRVPRAMVSAIIAVRNEEGHIESVLASLLQQDAPDFDLEFIVVDGYSNDGTPHIVQRVAAADNRVNLITNERKSTPDAFNLGLHRATGDYVCILGAHTVYARDYIATCLQELKRSGAAGCSGRAIVCAGGEGLEARLVAWALAHPFGTSTRSMRTRGAGFADSIPYPVFLKRALIAVGGYNTELHRNQDNDICQKLRAQGWTLFITDKTSCKYFVSATFASLSRYAFKTGFWNFISLKVNPASMALRHFVPAAFAAMGILSVLAFTISFGATGGARLVLRSSFLLLAISYGIVSLAAAGHVAFRQRSIRAMLLPVGFLVLHFSYGIGTLTAMAKNARPPEGQMSQT
jgi:glycosyltransferase involved in cell wall biosynthesis